MTTLYDDQRIRWVRCGTWVYHLAVRTCQDKWVPVCKVIDRWPFEAKPVEITLTDGRKVWMLEHRVEPKSDFASVKRVTLNGEGKCPECSAFARDVARLWRGTNRARK